tara:strand:- start:176 stop:547 length:372 start_codon:yes stop_codon:yes gene_type:complete
MSTLKVNTIQNTSGGSSSTPEQIEQGRAKAWVNFDGESTVAIRDSFNVSSITDNGTGNYFVNFSNAMANTNYCVVTGAGGGTGSLSDGSNVSNLATNRYRQEFGNGGSYSDFDRCFSMVLGDQ